MQTLRTSVLVVGAGPVGLTLAMDLAWRGIDVVVVELRHRGELPNVKCNHVAARSMEIFRRFGVAQKLRNAGLPADYPNDAAFRTTTTGIEFGRIPIPCRRDRYTATEGPDTWWPTPEPPHRINQLFMEPILFAQAAALPGVTIFNRTRLADFDQTADGVTAIVEDLDGGDRKNIECAYMVGCDGARSEVRHAIGARFTGDAIVQRTQSSYIRAPALMSLMRSPPAWANFSYNPRRSGNMFAIDGRETWLIHNYLRAGETEFEAVDRDLCIRQILGVGADFSYEIISKEDWIGRRMIADRFRDRRVFICGDAAHIWVPNAGYGMNAGIADAMDLSWMLAAVLLGWGAPGLLAAHEAERLSITEQVSQYAMGTALALARQRAAVPDNIEDPGPEGDAVRARVGREAYDINVAQLCCGGLNFGSFYDASPIIAHDGEPAPPYTLADFTPSTVPGCRTPHVWLRDGFSLYDAMGPGYTLLRFDPTVEVSALVAGGGEAARSAGGAGCRLRCLAPYRHKLLLARTDQHVAWRGDEIEERPLALIDLIRGAPPA